MYNLEYEDIMKIELIGHNIDYQYVNKTNYLNFPKATFIEL
jgi:hypothetical protein